MTRTSGLRVLAVCALAGIAAPVCADAVSDWNEIAVNAVNAGRPGPTGMIDVALVQVAVHDAVQALDRRYEPYHAEVPGARGRRSAAVAAAAHDVLVAMYPAQSSTLDAMYFSWLADHGLSSDPGLDVGSKVAKQILPLRRVTPDPLPPPFIGGTTPGSWRPTDSKLGDPPLPPPFSPMAAPWMASFDPFTLTSPARYRAAPPPAITSETYARDYREVKALGSLNSTARSAEQTDLAYFYSDNFITQWNRALRGIAARHSRHSGESARLFALVNLAMADALITCWDSKVHYVYWRPETAIQEGDNDGNAATIGDPSWQPLINNPNYPDFTSGANVLTGAATRALELYFGTDRMYFEMTSLAPQAKRKSRWYRRFTDVASDVVEARILLGIHFRFADVAARTQGRRTAEWTVRHFLLPLDKRHGN